MNVLLTVCACAAHAENTNRVVMLGTNFVRLADIEQRVKEQAQRQGLDLPLDTANRQLKFHNTGPAVLTLTYSTRSLELLCADVDTNGIVTCRKDMLGCGGVFTEAELEARRLEGRTTPYSWNRTWVERHCATSSVPASQQVFVLWESRPRAGVIVEHQSGMTLYDVIAQTLDRESRAMVQVLRPTGPIEGERVRSDSPQSRSYQIRALDLVTIYSTGTQK